MLLSKLDFCNLFHYAFTKPHTQVLITAFNTYNKYMSTTYCSAVIAIRWFSSTQKDFASLWHAQCYSKSNQLTISADKQKVSMPIILC